MIVKKKILILVVAVVVIGSGFLYLLSYQNAGRLENIETTLADFNTALAEVEQLSPDRYFHPGGITVKNYLSQKELTLRTMEEGGFWNCGGGRNTTPLVPDRAGMVENSMQYRAAEFIDLLKEIHRELGLRDMVFENIELTDNHTAVVKGKMVSPTGQEKTSEELSLTLVSLDKCWLIREVTFKFSLPG